MSVETDISVFKQDLENAVVTAHKAVDDVKQKFETYLEKLGQDSSVDSTVSQDDPVTPSTTSSVSEAPENSTVPSA